MQNSSAIVGLLCVAFACLAYAADEKPSPPAHYDFTYAVNEPATGDQKDQHETREGDNVNGYYRTLDADGYLRTVTYKSDAVNGFTAEVVREPVSGFTAPAAKAVVKAVVKPYTAPVIQRVAAPVAVPYVAPAQYAAPAPSYYQPAVPYQYQPPSYSYGYQPYPYAYSPYPYGVSPYPYSGRYPYTAPLTTVRK